MQAPICGPGGMAMLIRLVGLRTTTTKKNKPFCFSVLDRRDWKIHRYRVGRDHRRWNRWTEWLFFYTSIPLRNEEQKQKREREAAALCNCSIKSNKIRSRNSWLSTKSRTRADAADLPLVIYFIRKWRVIDRQSNRFLMVSGQKGSAVIVNFFFSSFCSTIVQAGRLHRFFPPISASRSRSPRHSAGRPSVCES